MIEGKREKKEWLLLVRCLVEGNQNPLVCLLMVRSLVEEKKEWLVLVRFLVEEKRGY